MVEYLARAFYDTDEMKAERDEALGKIHDAQTEARLALAKVEALARVQRTIDAVVKLRKLTPRNEVQMDLPDGTCSICNVGHEQMPGTDRCARHGKHIRGAKVAAAEEITDEDILNEIVDKTEEVAAAMEEHEEIALLLAALGMTEAEWLTIRHKYERAHL